MPSKARRLLQRHPAPAHLPRHRRGGSSTVEPPSSSSASARNPRHAVLIDCNRRPAQAQISGHHLAPATAARRPPRHRFFGLVEPRRQRLRPRGWRGRNFLVCPRPAGLRSIVSASRSRWNTVVKAKDRFWARQRRAGEQQEHEHVRLVRGIEQRRDGLFPSGRPFGSLTRRSSDVSTSAMNGAASSSPRLCARRIAARPVLRMREM